VGLTDAMGRPDLLIDPSFSTKAARIASMDAVDELVGAWTGVQTTDGVFALLRAAGVVCAPARSLGDVIADPYFRERGMIVDVDVPGIGTVPLIHTPLYFSDTERLPLDPAHGLGEDNESVFGDLLGRSADLLKTYRADGVI